MHPRGAAMSPSPAKERKESPAWKPVPVNHGSPSDEETTRKVVGRLLTLSENCVPRSWHCGRGVGSSANFAVFSRGSELGSCAAERYSTIVLRSSSYLICQSP